MPIQVMAKSMSDKNELTEEEQRHFWRLRWLSSLQGFTDEIVQARKWTDPSEGNPHFSFVECMCCYFDDADLADKESYERRIERGYITLAEADAVAEFHSSADQYQAPGGDDYNDEAILSDPAWGNVVEAAQRAQERLLLILTVPAEVAALTKPLVWEHVGGVYTGNFPEPA
jgi:hypothetical protein